MHTLNISSGASMKAALHEAFSIFQMIFVFERERERERG